MSQPPNILIVEDNTDIATLVQLALDQKNMNTHHCKSAYAALDYLQEIDPECPDLILLDIGMPGMNGWEFLEIIRKEDDLKHVPVIVATAFSDPANRVVGKLQQVQAYITKPYGPMEIIQIVESVLHLD